MTINEEWLQRFGDNVVARDLDVQLCSAIADLVGFATDPSTNLHDDVRQELVDLAGKWAAWRLRSQ